ncbi:MAG TPA: DUF4870 domain-containing protein [Caulobacteraceae bacterium]
MTETTATPPAAPLPPPGPPVQAASDERQMALIIYVLYLASFALGLTAIVGLVLAYVNRDGAPEWLKSHYTFQIRTFWIGLLYFAAACVLIVVVVGIPLVVAAIVWFIVRCALGLSRLLRNEPYPTPESWMV